MSFTLIPRRHPMPDITSNITPAIPQELTPNTEKELTPHYLGHRQRLKEKFLTKPFNDAFVLDYDKLEFALTFALPRKDTKLLAKTLLDKFGSLKQVLDAPYEDLCKVKGISQHTAIYINFLKNIAIDYSYLKIKDAELLSSPKLVCSYLISLLGGEKVECLYMISLNASNRLIKSIKLETGTVNKAIVQPRKIAQEALTLKSVGIILAHNHPGGILKPSQNDIEATNFTKSALEALDISLHDHIIISGNDYFSFKEYGIL
jgi:DNA repair protein RadC